MKRTLSEGMLIIRGEEQSERDEKDTEKNWHVIERSYGAFSRSIALPFEPDSGKVEAKFDKGVLRIRLPKPPEVAKKTAEDRDQKRLSGRRSALPLSSPRFFDDELRRSAPAPVLEIFR